MHGEIELGQQEDQRLRDEAAREFRLATRPARETSDGPGTSGANAVSAQESSEVRGQGRRRSITILGPLLEALEADQLEVPRNGGTQLSRRGRLVLDQLGQGLGHRRGAERRSARQELIQDRADAVDIGRRADSTALGLLGSHI